MPHPVPLRPLALAAAVLLVTGLGVAANRIQVPDTQAGPAPTARKTTAPRRAPKPKPKVKPKPKPALPPPLKPVQCAPDRQVPRGVEVRGRVVDAWNRPVACSRVVLTPNPTLEDAVSGLFAAFTLGFACKSPGFCDWPGDSVALTDRNGRFTTYVDEERADHSMTVTTPGGDVATRALEVHGRGPVQVRTVRVWSFAPHVVRRGNEVTVRFTPPPTRTGAATVYVDENGHDAVTSSDGTNALVQLRQARSGVTFDLRRVEDRQATLYVEAHVRGLLQRSHVRLPAGPSPLSRGAWCTRSRGRCPLTDGVLADAVERPAEGKPAIAPRIDLGRVRRLRYVVVRGCGTGEDFAGPSDARAELEVSRDGRTWRHLTLGSERVGPYLYDCFGPVSSNARYVRLRGTVNAVSEVSLF